MSLILELQIGLFNAWLPALPIWTIGWIFLIVTKRETAQRLVDRSWNTKKDKKIGFVFIFSYYLMVFTTVITPLKSIKSIWFILGMIIYFLNLIPLIVSYYVYAKAPLDEPILKSVYRYSRNPMYFFATMSFFGIFVATKSPLIMITLIICTISQHFLILAEEKYCIGEYKKEYKKYMKKVPRYFLFF